MPPSPLPSPSPPRIVAVNPWGSRRAWVDDDGVTTYLHLGPAAGDDLVSEQSVWVRNDGPAPELTDLPPDVDAPAAPPPRLPQPRRATRHPDGRPLAPGQVLELLWFEQGDGVVLVVDGSVEAILPSWSGGEGGMRGYAVEARGRGPFAWELIMPNPLSTRAARARAHWDALNSGALWPAIEQASVAHLSERLGAVRDAAWMVHAPGEPPRQVSRFPLDGGVRLYTTVGMSAQPMPAIEAYREDHPLHQRVEIALASDGELDSVTPLLGLLARYPWRRLTWLADGDVVEVPPDALEPAGAFAAVLLLAAPPPDGPSGRAAPDLSGRRDRSGDPVNHLYAIPLTPAEHALAAAEGPEAVVDALVAAGRGFLFHPPNR